MMALVAMVALGANAQEKKAEKVNPNKPVFTVVKENKITSIKDQNRSGTCWNYSTLSYFEAEILKATGKVYDLEESFVTNKTYMDRAIQVVRLHGDCQFAQGGSAYDPLYCIQNYGHHAFPRQSVWRLTEQLQRVLHRAVSLCQGYCHQQQQETVKPVEGGSAGHPRCLPRQVS